MGMYLNPGNEAFKRALRSEIYVDKSGMIEEMNRVLGTDQGFLCVSRPRRFGKSMAANMLVAYYDKSCDSSELFKNLEIAKSCSYLEHLNKHDVIVLNVQKFLRKAETPENLVAYMEKKVLLEIRAAYSEWVDEDETSLPDALELIFANQTGENKGFIFIMDEWDCMFREAKDHQNAQKQYLDFLRDLFKDRVYVKAAYMTGILPIKKYGTHSALNIFREFSMASAGKMAKYTGFTEDEVRSLCEEHDKDFEQIQKWYDGYLVGNDIHIYNPKSVVDSMQSEELKSFWTSTETYEALQVYIDLDMDGIQQAIVSMLGGESCTVDIDSFQNDMTTLKSKDDILSLLIHLGYLAYDRKKKSAFIPNEEVRLEFVRAIKYGKHQELAKMIQRSDKLLQDTLSMNEEAVAEAIEETHNIGTTPLYYNNEQALRSVIRFAYLSCFDEFQEIQELPSGKGYADLVYLPKKNSRLPIMVIELKWNKDAESAIEQIKEKQYQKIFEGYGSEMLLVGINYDAETKKHSCVIEKYRC